MVCIFATHKNLEFTEWSNFEVSYCWKHATRITEADWRHKSLPYLTFLDLGFMLTLVVSQYSDLKFYLQIFLTNIDNKVGQVWRVTVNYGNLALIAVLSSSGLLPHIVLHMHSSKQTKTHRLHRLMRLSKLLLKFSNWLPPIMGHLFGS
jgi:hypothetical protein